MNNSSMAYLSAFFPSRNCELSTTCVRQPATVNLYLKNYDRAIYYGQASLKVAESDNNIFAKTSYFLILGIIYLCQNNHQQAIQYTEKGVNLACQYSVICNEAWGYCNFEKIFLNGKI